MKNLKKRISRLLEQISHHVYEKEHTIALSLLSAIAGESIFLLGPPGVAKSMVARRLKLAFKDATNFEYLMSRFSTPDEIFGPVSISKLKDQDTYERMTEGYLPTADIVFLDEIWKAGPAIQNSLLTVINEKIYRNGQFSVQIPLKGLIAASNELPASDQGLEALWDRFIIRLYVSGINGREEFERMICDTDEDEPQVDDNLSITHEEYTQIKSSISDVSIPPIIFDVIHTLKQDITSYNIRNDNGDITHTPLYVSDRRWKKIVRLLRTSAYLNDRKEISLTDCFLITHCIWNDIEHQSFSTDLTRDAIKKNMENFLYDSTMVNNSLQEFREQLLSVNYLRENDYSDIKLVDSFYYQIQGGKQKEKLLIFASDFQKLTSDGMIFYLHKDKHKPGCAIFKKYDPVFNPQAAKSTQYTLRHGNRSVFINDYEYPLLCDNELTKANTDILDISFHALEERIRQIETHCEAHLKTETTNLDEHLFLSEREKQTFRRMLSTLRLNLTRQINEFNELKDAYQRGREKGTSN